MRTFKTVLFFENVLGEQYSIAHLKFRLSTLWNTQINKSFYVEPSLAVDLIEEMRQTNAPFM